MAKAEVRRSNTLPLQVEKQPAANFLSIICYKCLSLAVPAAVVLALISD